MPWESIAQLGGTVTTVALFIWYLYQKNGKSERAMNKVFENLDRLSKAQERHTRVLINVSKAQGLEGDSDDLINS
jgi:hypothetical protein